MAAKTPRSRGAWALRGLSHADAIDPSTQSMLLRQLYLCHYAQRHFEQAYEVACQAATLDVLTDVMHQDAARAKQAVGDIETAVGHLRLAARRGPPSRRAFHWWTLGSVFFLAGRHQDAIAALGRAARWGTSDKPLYQGHLALAKCRAGRRVRGLGGLIERLATCPAGQGYGRFVLGQLAFQRGCFDDAHRYLTAFVSRTRAGRPATRIALEGELQMAEATLAALERAS